MEQKTFSTYWRMVLSKAFNKAWDKFGALGTALGLIVAIIVAYFKSPTDFENDGAIMTAIIFLVLFIGVIGVYILREPVIILNEQQEINECLSRENNKLKDEAKPKLELSYDETKNTSHQDWGENIYDFRVVVKNVGGVRVNGISIKIKETQPEALPYFPFELGFTHNDPNSLNTSDYCFVDVLETHPERENLFFCAREANLKQPCPIQGYKILISASGDNSPVIEKWFKFSVDLSNKVQPYTFGELVNDET